MRQIETFILISIDGMRPDGLQQAHTPAIDGLIQRGAYTYTAQTVMPSITLPCHTSMFRGVAPERHGITANTWIPMARPIPSIIEVVHNAGRKTASFYGWEPLRDLSSPGALDFACFQGFAHGGAHGPDAALTEIACDYLARERPAFVFLYLGWTDEVGHAHGWMSPEYIEAIGQADAAIDSVVQRLTALDRLDQVAFIVQSDHGGHGYTHSPGTPEDTTIPWIIAGPGIRRQRQIKEAVHITATAPTIAHALGLPLPEQWTGRPVLEVFEEETN